MRLSSPTYDDQMDELDANDIQLLDHIELSMSQKSILPLNHGLQKHSQDTQSLSQEARQKRLRAITDGLSQDDAKRKRIQTIVPALGVEGGKVYADHESAEEVLAVYPGKGSNVAGTEGAPTGQSTLFLSHSILMFWFLGIKI